MESVLFQKKTLEDIFDLQFYYKLDQTDQYAHIKIIEIFIKFLHQGFFNEPRQIGKMADDGMLKTIFQFLTADIMPTKQLFVTVIQLICAVAIHDKGRALVKETKIFEQYMMPNALNKRIAIRTIQSLSEDSYEIEDDYLMELLKNDD